MRRQYDGFWFPPLVRGAILTSERSFEYSHFKGGRPVPQSDGETVTVRWPRLTLEDWQRVLGILRGNQQNALGALESARGENQSERLPQAIHRMQTTWTDRTSPLRQSVLEALETCTGHSTGMLDAALGLLDLISINDLQQAASAPLPHAVKDRFVALDGLPGRLRFFVEGQFSRLATQALSQFKTYRERSWHLQRRPTNLILGHAAGNVPGTGLLLILLALGAASVDRDTPPPVIIVKNSRLEPLFTPLVLTALELIDPTLLNTTLVTIWDYTDATLQEYLIAQADLVVAAASDETIESIGQIVRRVSTERLGWGRSALSAASRPVRFHGHGHKVSFSTVGRECLERERKVPESGIALMDVVALLASLDVVLWNQQGCLSSRVHFVEQGSESGHYSPENYGQAVTQSLRALNKSMPKGVSRKRQIHNLFDKYQVIAASNPVRVLSDYDDDFLVVLDRRALTPDQFREVVNDCQGRSVIVLPVDDVLEVPQRFLQQVRREHLQSMSVALGNPDEPGIAPRLLQYAEALGEVGVTSIRTVGRGAFPQLAYSWDGLIPLDLTVKRQKGYFTAVEFDEPWAQIYETHRLVQQAMKNRM